MADYLKFKITVDDVQYAAELQQFFTSNAGNRYLKDLDILRESIISRLDRAEGEEKDKLIGAIRGLDFARTLPARILDAAKTTSKEADLRRKSAENEETVDTYA